MFKVILTVFIATFVLDFVWAIYTRAISKDQSFGAAVAAAGIMALSGTAAIVYVDNPWMLIPAMIGAFAGTYSSMRLLKKRKPPNPIFRMVCIRDVGNEGQPHICRIDGPCNGLPRDGMSREEAYERNMELFCESQG